MVFVQVVNLGPEKYSHEIVSSFQGRGGTVGSEVRGTLWDTNVCQIVPILLLACMFVSGHLYLSSPPALSVRLHPVSHSSHLASAIRVVSLILFSGLSPTRRCLCEIVVSSNLS